MIPLFAIILAFITAGFGLIGWVVSKTFFLGQELSKTRDALATAKRDRDGLGEKIRQLESKFFFFVTLTVDPQFRTEVLEAMTRRHN